MKAQLDVPVLVLIFFSCVAISADMFFLFKPTTLNLRISVSLTVSIFLLVPHLLMSTRKRVDPEQLVKRSANSLVAWLGLAAVTDDPKATKKCYVHLSNLNELATRARSNDDLRVYYSAVSYMGLITSLALRERAAHAVVVGVSSLGQLRTELASAMGNPGFEDAALEAFVGAATTPKGSDEQGVMNVVEALQRVLRTYFGDASDQSLISSIRALESITLRLVIGQHNPYRTLYAITNLGRDALRAGRINVWAGALAATGRTVRLILALGVQLGDDASDMIEISRLLFLLQGYGIEEYRDRNVTVDVGWLPPTNADELQSDLEADPFYLPFEATDLASILFSREMPSVNAIGRSDPFEDISPEAFYRRMIESFILCAKLYGDADEEAAWWGRQVHLSPVSSRQFSWVKVFQRIRGK